MEFNHSDYLVGEWHEPYSGHHRLYRFENGFGASVISGPYSYGGDKGLFELAVLRWRGDDYELCYDTEITEDVIGYLDFSDVVDLLKRIKELSSDHHYCWDDDVEDLEN